MSPDPMDPMTVQVNGEPLTLPGGASVAEAVARVSGRHARRVAVARNGEVVPRSSWEGTRLREGDRIEVVTAIQGGSR